MKYFLGKTLKKSQDFAVKIVVAVNRNRSTIKTTSSPYFLEIDKGK